MATDVQPGRGMQEALQRPQAAEQARREIGQNEDAEDDVEPLEQVCSRQKRRDDDEQHRQDVESEKAIAERLGAAAVTFVETPDGLAKRAVGHERIL